MLHPFKPDVTGIVAKAFGDRVGAIGIFGAVDTPACQQAGDRGDGNAVDLSGQDVVDALAQIGDVLGKASGQATGDFAQKDARFGARIEEGDGGVCPDIGAVVAFCPGHRQHVEHAVGQLGRGKDLIAGEVGDTREHIWVAPT